AGTGSAVDRRLPRSVSPPSVSPSVGLGGEGTGIPMAVAIVVCSGLALTSAAVLARDSAAVPARESSS
ncbi:major facilitator superfamily multidrug resistance protein, partial [Rhodococcus pyridinivorans AK37]